MRKGTTGLALLIMTGCLLLATSGAVDITGTWKGTTEVPDAIDPDELTLVVEKKEGVYHGVINDSFGYCQDAECSDLELAGDQLTFNFLTVDGNTIYITLTVKGDSMAGHWEDEDGSGAEITMTKK